MSQIKLSLILERPISEEQWPQLDTIIKALQEFIHVKAKNREYLEAQRAKEKIIQCQDQIKKRSYNALNNRENQSLQQLRFSHDEERMKLEKEWDVRKRKIEKEFSETIEKKGEKYSLEKEKYLQQLEIALPLNNSPDKVLYNLKNQEEAAAQCGDFERAQKVKMEIMKKELQFSKKYQKLRQTNIKTMMTDLQHKQTSQILILEARRDEKLSDNQRQKDKRYKQLSSKHERQIKQLVWIYNEQKKKIK